MAAEVLQGTCDLCGETSDATLQECNQLSCTFAQCDDLLYHQSCLDKFLRSNKLDKSRKTGFKCPRGCGKGSSFPSPCPGRIDKSHPIYPRNETKKLKAIPVPEPPKSRKERETGKAAKHGKQTDEPKKEPKAKPAPVVVKPAAAPASNGPTKAELLRQQQQQLQEAKAAARRDLGLERAGSSSSVSSGAKLFAAPAPAAPAPWAKASASGEAAGAPSGGHTLSMHPQLQQLFSKAPARPSAPAAAVVAASASQPPPPPPAAAATAAAPQLSLSQFPPVAAAPATRSAAAFAAAPMAPSPAAQQHPTPAGAAARPTPDAAAAAPAHPPVAVSPPPVPSPPLPPSASPGTLPVGMEYTADAESSDPTKLTKAQKKNLKRAEKKKKAADEGGMAGGGTSGGAADAAGSAAGSEEPESEGALLERAERDTIREEMFAAALVCRKTLGTLHSLQRLSFSVWQAAAAVQRHGTDLHACVAWLLEQEELGLEPLAARAGEPGAAPLLPVVDVGDELRRLAEVQSGLGVGSESMQDAVVEASGDVPGAIEMLLDQARDQRTASPGLGGAAAAIAGGRPAAAAAPSPSSSTTADAQPAAGALPTALAGGSSLASPWLSSGAGGGLSNGGSVFSGLAGGLGAGLGVSSTWDAPSALTSPLSTSTAPLDAAGSSGALSPMLGRLNNSATSNASAASGLTFNDWTAAAAAGAGTAAPAAPGGGGLGASTLGGDASASGLAGSRLLGKYSAAS